MVSDILLRQFGLEAHVEYPVGDPTRIEEVLLSHLMKRVSRDLSGPLRRRSQTVGSCSGERFTANITINAIDDKNAPQEILLLPFSLF